MTFQYLGEALGILRRRKGLRQYEVARLAAVTRPMLSAYETGKQVPTLSTLERILAALEADLFDLAQLFDVLANPAPGPQLTSTDSAATTSQPSLRSLALQSLQAFEVALRSLVREVIAEELRKVQAKKGEDLELNIP